MASQALEFLQESSESRIQVYDEKLDEEMRKQHEKEELLERVDINKDFTVYYQEKVDIRTQKIIGAEALVRFVNPFDDGQVFSPGFFVPYYEKTGKIKQLDFFVLETTCRMLRRRMDCGETVVPVSCNFSRRHFEEKDFPEKLEAVLEKYNIPKDLIEAEITETIVIEVMQQQNLQDALSRLKQKNIRLSIDDFGSGYSSLGVFERVPASVIKLDRSFLLNHTDRMRQVEIMRHIVSLAEALSAQIVCEGVENLQDVELMQEIGAYVAQGYYYAKPVPEDAFERRLQEQQLREISNF
jgi:EAL domain-containing protein (putative c-di-GMP-specific phosphodiesterase class I)